ncbi:MAG: chromosome segregation protein SMC [Anaerolineaceae bacterium]|nr:chromosome segregation protein SMC [Anaerolineaceae bacterium]
MTIRLKALELHGYKTFASKVNFEFPAEITTIVGPNGSGKSNVADAIRWVLGEQSFSLLRGRKTEDMIFSGSNQRSRAGMASVNLLLDNENGWLPLDYSEVLISRRAYRDGQNEYLLNGHKVRLKEITEILSKSGLAQRTYTIIGQGLVDVALSLKPDERRTFFEEAAGISLYRKRREESLTKIQTTNRNIERASDILGELKPRLRSLEKQMKRSREYERITAELNILMREWYGYHWHKVQQELSHAKTLLQVQEERMSAENLKKEEFESQIDGVQKKLHENRSRLNHWHSESATAHSDLEKISRNLAVIDERIKAITGQKLDLQIEIFRLEEEKNTIQDMGKAQKTEYDSRIDELNDARHNYEVTKKNFQTLVAERKQVDNELHAISSALKEFETRKVESQIQSSELQKRIEYNRKSKEDFQQRILKYQKTHRILNEKLEDTKRVEDNANTKVVQIEKKLETLLGNVKERSDQLEVNRTSLERINREISKLTSQLDLLEQAEQTLIGVGQGTSFLLESTRSGMLSGKYMTLSKGLQVPVELEVAISSALGENLNGVVLENNSDAMQALELLAEKKTGQAILFPLTELKQGQPLKRILEKDCLGFASDLVNVDSEIRPIVELLLSRVIIVNSRETARKMLKDIPQDAKVVTLTGEVFFGNGKIIAGKKSHTDVFSKSAEMETIRINIQKLEEQRDNLQGIIERHIQEHEKKLLDVKDLERDLLSGTSEKNDVVEKHRQIMVEYVQVQQQIEVHQKQLDDLGVSESRIIDELNGKKLDFEKAQAGIDLFSQKVIDKQEIIKKLNPDDLQSEVTHWQTKFAVLDQSIKDQASRILEMEVRLKNFQAQEDSKRRKFSELSASIDIDQEQRNKLREQENVIRKGISEFLQEIEPGQIEVEKLEKLFESLQKQQSAAQQAYSTSERFLSRAQLEVTRRIDDVDALRRRIEDDFGLVVFEYHKEISGPTPLPFDGIVNELPAVESIPPDLEDSIKNQRSQLRRIGAVNPDAEREYWSVKERHDFLIEQIEDLHKADADLKKVITELNGLMRDEFQRTFHAVAIEFKKMFTRLFGGGNAKLIMIDESNPSETGIEIEAQLPGRRKQGLALLSGGERSLTAVALIFALLKISPTPFCVLDEVDAALDEANVGRFSELLRELSVDTQFVIITHNRNTVEMSDVIYGVTMGRDSSSQVISLRLDEVSAELTS